jgi:hypothetical protein
MFWEINFNVRLILVPWEKDPFLVTVLTNIDVLSFYNTNPTFVNQVIDVILDSLVAVSKFFVIFYTMAP